jgi:glucan phosphoethanolaminetransferase (alkaline phosphatase superfamily)
MSYKQLSWKFMLLMMCSGLLTCLLILFILYIQQGYLKNSEIISVIIAFILSCLLLILGRRSFQKNFCRDDTPDKNNKQ